MNQRDEFDDEGFFDSLLNRKGNTALPRGLRRIFVVIAVLVVIIIVAAVTLAAIPKHSAVDDGAPVPIIRADSSPFKIKPQDPGGMKVPNKDSTIFETLKGEKEEPRTENLLDDATAQVEPVARPEPAPVAVPPVVADAKPEILPPQPAPVTSASVKSIPPQETLLKGPEPETKLVEPKTKPEEKTPSIIESLKQDNKSAEEKLPTPKPAVKPVAKPAARGGSTYIQLAAVKSEAEAASQWSKIKAKNFELTSLSMRTQKVDLGDKGIFYRIQAGPLPAQAATDTCAAVKGRGGSCIIAK